MPKVGEEEFAYTPEGIEKAKQKAEETGLPMSNAMERSEIGDSTDYYNIGGLVNPIYKKGGKV